MGKRRKPHKGEGPSWGFLTFLATVVRIVLDCWRNL